jgi:deoxyribose-phosphate aldolase
MTRTELAALIDHSALRPDVTDRGILTLCDEARQYGFYAVCVNARFAPLAAAALRDSAVRVCAVVGFPLGATTTQSKCQETAEAVAAGAHEIDMVLAIGALKSGQTDVVRDEIAAVKAACNGALLKVIIEACLLTDDEKVLACELARDAGADFVKTSTGFSKSGGVSTFEAALARVAAGASRIGASASVRMVSD